MYTHRGSTALEEQIAEDMQDIAEAVHERLGEEITALVLGGGYGRGEGTPFQTASGEQPFNDYDCFVVAKRCSYFRRKKLQALCHALEKELSIQLGIAVDLFLHTPDTLRKAEPTLMNYELKLGHQVVWGDRNALAGMPAWKSGDIPLTEGTRLLMNRGALLFLQENLPKFLWKVDLACGDALLLLAGRYDVLYRKKREVISSLLDWKGVPEGKELVHRYLQAVEFKERGDPSLLPQEGLSKSYREWLLRFFLWYEGVRLGCTFSSPQQYAEALPLQDREAQGVWGFLRALQRLRGAAFRPPGWLLMHPRWRLFAALPLLLAGKDSRDLLGGRELEELRGKLG